MVLGVSCYSFLIGTMSSLLQAIDTKGHILAEKFRLVNEFCNQGHINPFLKEKIKRAIEYRTNNYYFALFETNSLLEELPPKLKYKVTLTSTSQIAMSMQGALMGKFDIFRTMDHILVGNLMQHLQPLKVENDTYIYTRGERADRSNLIQG
jgi:hypothetical protein